MRVITVMKLMSGEFSDETDDVSDWHAHRDGKQTMRGQMRKTSAAKKLRMN